MNKPTFKMIAIKFVIYMLIGFAVAFIYRQIKN